ncbi:MAG: PepSY domain-containing protein [Rhodospirillales bacterium]
MSNRPMSLLRIWLFAGLLAGLGLSVAPRPSWALMSEAQVRAAVENDYDVKVIKITPGIDTERVVFYVRIMYNGGNFNTAFQINTIVIDAETGKRIAQFRHGSSGRTLPGNFDSIPNRQLTDALRGRIRR